METIEAFRLGFKAKELAPLKELILRHDIMHRRIPSLLEVQGALTILADDGCTGAALLQPVSLADYHTAILENLEFIERSLVGNEDYRASMEPVVLRYKDALSRL